MFSKKPILRLLIESGMIIFSVLFALFLSEWRNDYNQDLKTQRMLSNIKEEILDNQRMIEDLNKYHSEVITNLDSIISNNTEESIYTEGQIDFRSFAPKGIIQESMNDIAWTVAKENDITNHIPFDNSVALYEVYEQQRVIKRTMENMFSLVYSREFAKKELLHENLQSLNNLFSEVKAQEDRLIDYYENALEVLD